MWHHNLKADLNIEIRDETQVYLMRVRESVDKGECQRLALAVAAFLPYQDYQNKTERLIFS